MKNKDNATEYITPQTLAKNLVNNEEQNSTNYHPIQDFYRHQREVLKTHQQYLAQQMEYARAFWQVLQQFSHESDGKLIDLPAGIQQNLQWFHHHQQETLKIHEQYLQGQSEQTQIALQWGINADGVVPALPRVSSSSTVLETKPAPPNLLPKFEPPAPNYNPAPTPLLKFCDKKGCMTIDGLKMLVAQGMKSLSFWTDGLEVPFSVMNDALQKYLKKNDPNV